MLITRQQAVILNLKILPVQKAILIKGLGLEYLGHTGFLAKTRWCFMKE